MADIWALGSSVSGGAFTDGNHESVAADLETMGHTVTRTESSTVTTAPLLSDCDVVVWIDNTVGGGTTTMRATDTSAAPIVSLAPAYNTNSAGYTALHSSHAYTGASDDEWQILSTTPDWTDGHAVNDTVTVYGFPVYTEELINPSTGGEAFIRTPAANRVVCYGFDAGTTNEAGDDLTARVVTTGFLVGIQHANTDATQIWDDLLTWAQGAPAQSIEPSGLDASAGFGTPTATPGNATRSVDSFATPAVFGSAELGSEIIAQPSGLDASATLGGPLVDTLGTLSPPGADFGPDFGTVGFMWDQILEPTGLDTSASFGDPVPVPDQILEPTGLATPASFGSIAFDLTAERTPPSLDASPSFGAADLGGVPTAGWQLNVRTRSTATGDPDHKLFNFTNARFTDPLNGVGVGQFSIPIDVPDFVAARDTLLGNADCIVDFVFDGTRQFRMIVESDELVEMEDSDGARLVATFLGRSFGAELDAIIALPTGYPTSTSEVRETSGPGPQAWATMINQGQSLGAGELLQVGFGTSDSNGSAWSGDTEVDARITVGTTALAAAESLLVPGEVEWSVSGDGDLLCAPSLGSNVSQEVRFRVGAHQLARTRRRSKRSIVNQVLVLGSDGTIEAVDNATSVSAYGGRQTLVRAATTSVADRQAIASAISTSRGGLIESVQVRVDPWQTGAKLWVDWGLGDTVGVDVEGIVSTALAQALKVSALTVETDGSETAVEVVLGTDAEIAADVWSRRIDRVINSQTVGLQQGGGSVTDQLGVAYTHDGVNPTGLSVVNRGGAAVNEAAINVSWTAPAGDGSTSVAAYEVVLADPNVFIYGVARERHRTSTTNLAVFGLIPNTGYTIDVYAINPLGERIGQVTTTYTTPSDTTVPAQVTGVSVIGSFNALRAVWSENSEPDVANNRGQYRVQVDTDPGFGSPDIDEVTAGTILNLTGVTGGSYNYVRVAAIDSSGNQGWWSSAAASPSGLITSGDITDGTIQGGDIGAGTVTGGNIGSGTVTGSNIGSGTVSGGNIGYQTVTGGNIGLGTVTGSNVGGSTIGGSNIAGSTISGGNIAGSTITGSNIAYGTITADDIATYTITSDRIASGAITAGMITVGTMSPDRVGAGTLNSGIVLNGNTGGIYASYGSFTGAVTATSGSFTGAITATSGSFTGTVTAGSFLASGLSISNPNITGGATVIESAYLNWPGTGSLQGVSGTLQTTASTFYCTGQISADGALLGGSGTITGAFNVNGYLNNSGRPQGSFGSQAGYSSAGRLRESTSSIRFKDNVEARSATRRPTPRAPAGAVAGAADGGLAFLDIDAVSFDPKACDNPGVRYSGFIAEDLADAGYEWLITRTPDGDPHAVLYEWITAEHHVVLQALRDRVEDLEAEVAALR